MYENVRVFETEFAGRPLKVQTGKMGQLANGSCLISYGETSVFCAATASAKPRDGIDFLPLSVDFEEKLYDRDNGKGAAQSALDDYRARKTNNL